PAAGPDFYTVRRGDTLYGIALDHGQDYKDLAAWNNLANPNLIQVGQVLRVTPPPGAAADAGVVVRPIAPAGTAPAAAGRAAPRTEPSGAKRPYSDETYAAMQQRDATRPAPPPAAAPAPKPAEPAPKPAEPARPAEDDAVAWAWPAAGRIIGQFSENGTNKGIDIAVKVGDPVLAAGPGRVVYSGQGLRGYGRLIIIKHNNTYLSAYAHNSVLLAKEGQTVTRGQKIAEAGSTDADAPKLHFEIRRQGRPVDPLKLLPEQR
ncbi:MAG: peptidoglycan DD-metalloendopeptidase family protein, partial [Burkholderiales bacterium]|nr:peptidoglycan DD-metalloendopeptidase family protein [Burkholderiales bacterium]